MRFDQGAIEAIHSRIDIASFIGSYVALRKRGNDLVGLCPFHSEKTPSFHVHPDKGFFKCFGCGVAGDVIAFAQKHDNLPFPDAVRLLAQRAGIELEPETPQGARARSERETIYEANRLAAIFFERMLHSPAGGRVRAYCEKRGISASTIEKFHLGYALDQWNALHDELQRNGIEPALAAKAGLLKKGERGYYDFYRDRLIVPTYSTTGEVIAFGGRALGEGEPKYLNTSTTPVYTKGRHLFALNVARRAASQSRALIVVEGYLDCIALHQAGFENAVAALGTAFTEEQAKELSKYADGIFLCFDADEAGSAAAGKAIETAANAIEHAGVAVRIVELPAGSDPDSFIRERGAEAFKVLLEHAKLGVEFRLEQEVERIKTGFESPAKIAAAAEAIITRLAPPAERDRWRVWVARRLNLSENDLRNSRFLANRANFSPRSGGPQSSRHVSASAIPASFETEVLAIVLEEPSLLDDYSGSIPPERFRNDLHQRIYRRLLEERAALERTSEIFTLFTDDEEALSVLAALSQRDRSSTLRYQGTDDRRAHLNRVIERLQLDDAVRRYQELSHQIDDLVIAGQNVSPNLRDEFDSLVTKLKK